MAVNFSDSRRACLAPLPVGSPQRSTAKPIAARQRTDARTLQVALRSVVRFPLALGRHPPTDPPRGMRKPAEGALHCAQKISRHTAQSRETAPRVAVPHKRAARAGSVLIRRSVREAGTRF